MDRFEEIEVKRIKVVDDDGTVRMVLSAPPVPKGMFRGKAFDEHQRRGSPNAAGILFYNEEGTECGGLAFSGQGGGASMSLSFDQYESDQVMTLTYEQLGDARGYGLVMQDRPLISLVEWMERQKQIASMEDGPEKEEATERLKEGHANRLFLGRQRDGEVALYLLDSKGRPRIRVAVDGNDIPQLQFLSESGEVTYSIPQSA